MDITKEQFEFLEANGGIPSKICEEARELLTMFDRVHMTRANGEWRVTVGLGIRRHYAADHITLRLFRKSLMK